MRKSAAFLCVIVLALAFAGVGCPCIRGPINASENVRWWLFANFGAQKVCPEMLKRGVPLKVATLGPNSIGRFFPSQCQVQINDGDHSMAVFVAGSGYAFLPFARRVGFSAQARVEYRPDFRMESDAVYVWGRFSRMLDAPVLRITGVENPMVSLATQVPMIGDVGTAIGQGIAASEISRGFTVVRADDGDDFAIGILTPPDKPARAFKPGDDHKLLGSDQVDIHASEREYLGPFEVSGKDQVLFVKLRAQGAPLNVILVDRGVGDAWRQPYEAGQPLGPPPGPTIASGVVPQGESTQFFPLPAGLYYVVVENRATQPVAPLGLPIPMVEASGSLSYSIEVGDRPLPRSVTLGGDRERSKRSAMRVLIALVSRAPSIPNWTPSPSGVVHRTIALIFVVPTFGRLSSITTSVPNASVRVVRTNIPPMLRSRLSATCSTSST